MLHRHKASFFARLQYKTGEHSQSSASSAYSLLTDASVVVRL
jgi:hypothetical protein